MSVCRFLCQDRKKLKTSPSTSILGGRGTTELPSLKLADGDKWLP